MKKEKKKDFSRLSLGDIKTEKDRLNQKFNEECLAIANEIAKELGDGFKDRVFRDASIQNTYQIILRDRSLPNQSQKAISIVIKEDGSIDVHFCYFGQEIKAPRPPSKKSLTVTQLFAGLAEMQGYLLPKEA